MNDRLAYKSLLILGAVTVVGILLTAFMVKHMSDIITDKPNFSGQRIKGPVVETERFLNEPMTEWALRHSEAVEEFQE